MGEEQSSEGGRQKKVDHFAAHSLFHIDAPIRELQLLVDTVLQRGHGVGWVHRKVTFDTPAASTVIVCNRERGVEIISFS